MTRFRILPLATLALVVSLPPTAAAQELYKWVDGAGVVNYSSSPPAPAQKAQPVPQRVIVVSAPAPAIAPQDAAASKERQLQARLESLQREVDELKRAKAQERDKPKPAADPCSEDPRVNCARGANPELYFPQVVVQRAHPAPVIIPTLPVPAPRPGPHRPHRPDRTFGG